VIKDFVFTRFTKIFW